MQWGSLSAKEKVLLVQRFFPLLDRTMAGERAASTTTTRVA